ncbi:F0F1 ATP synthase subunit epsilon [Dongia deserti]|uniref:F0F1 ATP synthase subunit epsilon n=1 Tax=Dongia deserti TaxID=2268030 RepID=UPI000E65B533|nr:F0F1 ATP synthase subunit epsilon [Dongia deserti]
MPDTVKFELVSPERLLFSADVESVVVPGTEGDFGVLPGHARLISTVRPGVISVFQGGKVTDRIFVEGGFAEVTGAGCTVLAEHALPVAEIQRDQALQAIQDAREDVEDAKDDETRKEAMKTLEVAEARLQAVDVVVY